MTAAAFQATFRNCIQCSTKFHRRSRDANDRWEARKYCSRKCARAGNTVIEPLESRLSRLSIPVTECGCWLWLGVLDNGGYGSVRIGKKMIKAHRASWISRRGNIPDTLFVLHRCDMPSCINPDHLFLGSQAENMQDMIAKGRQFDVSGENNPNAKLTAADVAFIRNSEGSHKQVAKQFGVGKSIIGYIRAGQNWK